jgi:ribosome-associated translation inhibitor RaiA
MKQIKVLSRCCGWPRATTLLRTLIPLKSCTVYCPSRRHVPSSGAVPRDCNTPPGVRAAIAFRRPDLPGIRPQAGFLPSVLNSPGGIENKIPVLILNPNPNLGATMLLSKKFNHYQPEPGLEQRMEYCLFALSRAATIHDVSVLVEQFQDEPLRFRTALSVSVSGADLQIQASDRSAQLSFSRAASMLEKRLRSRAMRQARESLGVLAASAA